jgi:hypothetical protein
MLAVPARTAVAQETQSGARNTFLPVLGSAPETNLQFGGTWLRTFRRGPDATTRVSQFQLSAIGTTRNQRRLSATLDVWSAANRRRDRVRAEIMDFPTPVFAVGPGSPESAEGTYTASGLDLQWLHQERIADRFYLGSLIRFDGVRAGEEDFTEWDSAVPIPTLKTKNQVKVQVMATFDTRDHQLAARTGSFAQVTGSTIPSFGPFHDQTGTFKYGLDARRYWSVARGGVLAVQATTEAVASAHASAEFLPAIGADTIMRGYVRSRFRDDAAVSAQAEYRSGFRRRLGVVAFGGIATLGRSVGDLGSHGLISSYGAGLRYQLSAADRSRIRIDYARGRRGGALYVALGEAF